MIHASDPKGGDYAYRSLLGGGLTISHLPQIEDYAISAVTIIHLA